MTKRAEEGEPMRVHYKGTQFGFEYGAARVVRIASDKKGWVVIGVTSPKGSVEVHVTKTGKIRLWGNGQEMPMPVKEKR